MKASEPLKFVELEDGVTHWAFDSDDKCFCGLEKDMRMVETESDPDCEDCIKLFGICTGKQS